MYEHLLNADEILSKVSRYELQRSEGGRLFIDVHELIGLGSEISELPPKFIATPNIVVKSSHPQFLAVGDTEADALSKCLAQLKDCDFSDVIPGIVKEDSL
ncbi:MAG: hypothetical protein KTR20_12690 [Cellvibrionaceae bacterium]|nr:hypothetical protein [Cellvibrionaceae bacterium]